MGDKHSRADVLGALGFSMIICATVTKRGYVRDGERVRVTFLACLTTAIGLIAASASYFENLTHRRVKYGVVVGVLGYLVSRWREPRHGSE